MLSTHKEAYLHVVRLSTAGIGDPTALNTRVVWLTGEVLIGRPIQVAIWTNPAAMHLDVTAGMESNTNVNL